MILASQSPRRQQLMQLITTDFTVECANIDESAISAENPILLAQKLALTKAEAIFKTHQTQAVIGCDTIVNLDGVPLGKPKNEEEAIYMLTSLANKTHQVHTGICIFAPSQSSPVSLFTETTHVTFSPITQQEILAYVKTGDCFDKAGAYGIQGEMARFIPKIEGCYYNVMGLPVAAVYQQLKEFNLLSCS